MSRFEIQYELCTAPLIQTDFGISRKIKCEVLNSPINISDINLSNIYKEKIPNTLNSQTGLYNYIYYPAINIRIKQGFEFSDILKDIIGIEQDISNECYAYDEEYINAWNFYFLYQILYSGTNNNYDTYLISLVQDEKIKEFDKIQKYIHERINYWKNISNHDKKELEYIYENIINAYGKKELVNGNIIYSKLIISYNKIIELSKMDQKYTTVSDYIGIIHLFKRLSLSLSL